MERRRKKLRVISQGSHQVITDDSSGCNMVITDDSSGCNMVVTDNSGGCNMVVTDDSGGCNMVCNLRQFHDSLIVTWVRVVTFFVRVVTMLSVSVA